MSNNQIKKLAAEAHNKKRAKDKQDAIELAQDKIDHPEKYHRKRRGRGKMSIMPFIATSMAISPSSFN